MECPRCGTKIDSLPCPNCGFPVFRIKVRIRQHIRKNTNTVNERWKNNEQHYRKRSGT